MSRPKLVGSLVVAAGLALLGVYTRRLERSMVAFAESLAQSTAEAAALGGASTFLDDVLDLQKEGPVRR